MSACGLYVHVPFCRAKCAYCDFNSYAGCEALFGPYLAALRREMVLARERHQIQHSRPFRTLYVGGGTPTALPISDLVELVADVRRTLPLVPDVEATVEANPGTVDASALSCLRAAGVNRLSLGVQSFDARMLHTLGRIHSGAEARWAVRDARSAGFDNLNLDLMMGLPGQTLEAWQGDVRRALDLAPEHLSLYALTVEEGTPIAERIASGLLPSPDDDLTADMYEWTEELLSGAGYIHYEISNWALPGRACRHNLGYWRNERYLGLGAGAHSWWAGRRWSNLSRPEDYMRALREGRAPLAEEEQIDPALVMGETMMMGLRLLDEGVPLARFRQRFGVPVGDVYADQIAQAVERGLLERLPDRVRLTRRGHLLGNQVFAMFLP